MRVYYQAGLLFTRIPKELTAFAGFEFVYFITRGCEFVMLGVFIASSNQNIHYVHGGARLCSLF